MGLLRIPRAWQSWGKGEAFHKPEMVVMVAVVVMVLCGRVCG